MPKYSNYNIVYRLQKWIDSVPGQTFLNYGYSWGAAVVILGALFKLTHLPGANIMLFLGMGTEVIVFFLSAFDRPFDKTDDGKEIPTHIEYAEENEGAEEYIDERYLDDSSVDNAMTEYAERDYNQSVSVDTEVISQETIAMNAVTLQTPEMEEAQSRYIESLKNLTEMLEKVGEQSERLTRDSEEMENLNRTLTGITKVYEMQLKGASQQIGTIDQINAQSKKMAEQIEHLNKVYARMIEAMTVNMGGAPTISRNISEEE